MDGSNPSFSVLTPKPAEPTRLARPQRLDDLLLFRLSRFVGVAGAPVIRLCEGGHGITRREWRMLASLAQCPGLLSSELADLTQLDRVRTSRAVTSLVGKGLVNRAAVAGDRRRVRLRLTPAGEATVARIFPEVTQIHHSLLGALNASEQAMLDNFLDRLQDRADALALAGAQMWPKANRRRGRAARTRAGSQPGD